jgi:hypothetical protein
MFSAADIQVCQKSEVHTFSLFITSKPMPADRPGIQGSPKKRSTHFFSSNDFGLKAI